MKLILIIFFILIVILFSSYYVSRKEKIDYSVEKIENKTIDGDKNFIIPRNIVQSFSSRYVTERTKKNIENWVTMNEEYSYTYFDENEIVNFIIEHYSNEHLETFYKINAGAGRADFFRYLYLYKFGGVWVDITLVCNTPLREYIKETTELVLVHDVLPNNIYNAFMGFPKNHPVLEKCIEKCIEYVKNETHRHMGSRCIFHTTGPEMIKKEYFSYYKDKKRNRENTVVLKKKFSLTKDFLKKLDTYYSLYIFLKDKNVMKTKFDNAKKDLEFVSKKKHYLKLSFFNENKDFINGMINLKNNNFETEKKLSILIKSSEKLNKLNKFYEWVSKKNIINKFNIILIDDFSEKNELLETYYKLEKIGVKIKINPVKFNDKFLIEILNLKLFKLNYILYLDEEKDFDVKILDKIECDKTEILNLEKHLGVKSLYFHSYMINNLQKRILEKKKIYLSDKDEVKSTLKEELTS